MDDNNNKKRIVRIIVNSFITLVAVGIMSFPFLTGGMKEPRNPLSHKQVTEFDTLLTKVFTLSAPSEETFSPDDILPNIEKFIETPEGGISWELFAQTLQHEYAYTDENGEQWEGIRPDFSEALKALDGTEILLQGYMFPIGPDEKQEKFLLGPFPASCPFHYHITPNLIIEAHAKKPVDFSYDSVNIKGTLKLVPKDDEYNVFYRLYNAKIM